MKKTLLTTIITIFAYFVLVVRGVSAAAPPPPPALKGPVGCGGSIGIDTGIGCIPFMDASGKNADPTGIAKFFLLWGLGIGGGIALLLIVFASYQIITSSGDPHRLQAGKELLTSAVSGLILLIFSVYILRFIGIDILVLPGL